MKMTQNQFMLFRDLVYKSSGINLHEGKMALLQARLAKRLRVTGVDSVDEYLKLLARDGGEFIHFLDAISTNHTYFFRENSHFDYIQDHHERIWCAAASSGEEPYSLAIHCLEKGFKPRILATDISTAALQMAERGIYPVERAKNAPAGILKKYFQKGFGKWDGSIRVKEEVRRMVTFRRFNLVTDPPPSPLFDVILCRNVMIYFDRVIKSEVVKKLYKALKDNGYFIIGGSESLSSIEHDYKYIKPSIYRKVA